MPAIPEEPVLVFESIENDQHDRCVDLFLRKDQSYGFEEFRRNPEDGGKWTRVGYYSSQVFGSWEAALEAAERAVAWLGHDLAE